MRMRPSNRQATTWNDCDKRKIGTLFWRLEYLGYIPLTAGRLHRAERWPGILQELLGESY